MTRSLDQLDVLVGEWITASTSYSEGRGHTRVAPTEDGKFLRIESRADDNGFPQSTMLVGADQSRDEWTVLYYDSPGVYRVYQIAVVDGVWKVWREAPGFNQRYIGKIQDGGNTIAGRWEVSEDGKSWKVDFDLTYTKVRS